jgi:hypothetical protein
MKAFVFFVLQMIVITVFSILAGVGAGMITEYLIDRDHSRIGRFLKNRRKKQASYRGYVHPTAASA